MSSATGTAAIGFFSVYRLDAPPGKIYDIETYPGPGIYSIKDGPLVAVGATEVKMLPPGVIAALHLPR